MLYIVVSQTQNARRRKVCRKKIIGTALCYTVFYLFCEVNRETPSAGDKFLVSTCAYMANESGSEFDKSDLDKGEYELQHLFLQSVFVLTTIVIYHYS